MDYDVVIGLEIHAELATESKIFCSCKNQFGSLPNENTCPNCTGMPGSLPVLNKKAVEGCIKAGLSFGCNIAEYAVFERKNYFYPDLPKAYQISQLAFPLCKNGEVKLASGKIVRLNRIHLEEDAGKLIHINRGIGTLVDYNRGGTPLIEIVTEPDISNADEAVEFLKRVRETLVFAGIANCKMEEGGMRCDVNLSLKPRGSEKLGTRTETKNLNSFKSVYNSINFEIERQSQLLNEGEKIIQQTRKWDDLKGNGTALRSKEHAQDYRYFPDPDLLPIKISTKEIEKLKNEMPKSPSDRRQIYIEEFKLPPYDADILTSSKYISDYFEKCVSILNMPKTISNWIMVNLLKIVKEQEGESFPISEKYLVEIIKLVEEKKITKSNGLLLLEKTILNGKEPLKLANEMNLIVTISEEEILKLLEKLKSDNPKVAQDYKTDKEKVCKFITGYVMKNTQGKANGSVVEKLISKVF